MIRALSLLALVAACALAAPFNSIDDVPAEYKDLVPAQVKEFIAGISDEDKAVLKAIAGKFDSYKSKEAIFEALKENAPGLSEKVEQLVKLLREKLRAMKPEAANFVEAVFSDMRKITVDILAGKKVTIEDLQKYVVKYVGRFEKLSPEAKAEVDKQFPVTVSLIKNEKFQELYKKHTAA